MVLRAHDVEIAAGRHGRRRARLSARRSRVELELEPHVAVEGDGARLGLVAVGGYLHVVLDGVLPHRGAEWAPANVLAVEDNRRTRRRDLRWKTSTVSSVAVAVDAVVAGAVVALADVVEAVDCDEPPANMATSTMTPTAAITTAPATSAMRRFAGRNSGIAAAGSDVLVPVIAGGV